MCKNNIRYKAKCDNCDYETDDTYICSSTAQYFAGIHMMATGHTVQIKEVI